jgi:hypothetical protein
MNLWPVRGEVRSVSQVVINAVRLASRTSLPSCPFGGGTGSHPSTPTTTRRRGLQTRRGRGEVWFLLRVWWVSLCFLSSPAAMARCVGEGVSGCLHEGVRGFMEAAAPSCGRRCEPLREGGPGEAGTRPACVVEPRRIPPPLSGTLLPPRTARRDDRPGRPRGCAFSRPWGSDAGALARRLAHGGVPQESCGQPPGAQSVRQAYPPRRTTFPKPVAVVAKRAIPYSA